MVGSLHASHGTTAIRRSLMRHNSGGATGMDVGSLLNQAGGASAIAQQLGVDESTVERGASALVPHVANGVQSQGLPPADAGTTEPAQGGGLGGMLGGLLGGSTGGGGILGSLVSGG